MSVQAKIHSFRDRGTKFWYVGPIYDTKKRSFFFLRFFAFFEKKFQKNIQNMVFLTKIRSFRDRGTKFWHMAAL